MKKGSFRRGCDGKDVQRYQCRCCGKSFSNQTFASTYRQWKPKINGRVREFLCSSMSQRRIARVLRISKDTVARRLRWLASAAQRLNERMLAKLEPVSHFQFDEMETFEHTKCKPVSIAMLVEARTRRILGVRAVPMPCKGKLARLSLRKYGPRTDGRKEALLAILGVAKRVAAPQFRIESDECPRYPSLVRQTWSQADHVRHKGKRGCVVGQGELKATGCDPLFAFNHTAAMVRDDVKRLARRTWCTTKKIDRLNDVLAIYIAYRNNFLI